MSCGCATSIKIEFDRGPGGDIDMHMVDPWRGTIAYYSNLGADPAPASRALNGRQCKDARPAHIRTEYDMGYQELAERMEYRRVNISKKSNDLHDDARVFLRHFGDPGPRGRDLIISFDVFADCRA